MTTNTSTLSFQCIVYTQNKILKIIVSNWAKLQEFNQQELRWMFAAVAQRDANAEAFNLLTLVKDQTP
jgi:hypothetical protein